MATEFTPGSGFLGGLGIGVASVLLLLVNGRIAGISGILAGLLPPTRGDWPWRVAFIGGLMLGGMFLPLLAGKSVPFDLPADLPTVVIAGFLVGFGTRLGGGCTSGHGVCGVARGSARSIVATAIFMSAAMLTVLVVRWAGGS